MNLLKYTNDWEHDVYSVGSSTVTNLQIVEIDGVRYPVTTKSVSVQYDDMGHVYTSTSAHYFVEVNVLGVKTRIDLNTIVPKQKVYAVEYQVKNPKKG